MKTQTNIRRRAQLALGVVTLIPSLGFATVTGPYSVDANTLHLWHLDEVGTPVADQAPSTITKSVSATRWRMAAACWYSALS